MTDYEAQYLNEPHVRVLPIEEQLAIRYLVVCERFDRMFCARRDEHGDAQPSSQIERAAINRHAEQLMRQLAREHPKCDERKLRVQISSYGSRYGTEALELLDAKSGLAE